MKSEKLDRRPIVASIAASLLMLIFGLTYHTLEARLVAPPPTIPLVHDALERLPLEIADWVGEDIPMDKAIVRATGTDAHINRNYSRKNGLESISLFVGCSVSSFDRAIHRPEICYARAGWTLMDRRPMELSLDEGIKLPYSMFQFSRGDLNRQKSMVLHYYIVNGQYFEEVTALQAKLWRLGATVNYIARVLIVAPVRASNAETAEKLISSFAVDSAPSIAELFENIQNDQIAETTEPLKTGSSR